MGLFASAAAAVGLGELRLHSGLHQPVLATVPISVQANDAPDAFRVRLGSRDEFERAGLDWHPLLNRVRIELVQRDGHWQAEVRSTQALREPLLQFVLVLESRDVRVAREYALLPEWPTPANAQAVPGQIVASVGLDTAPESVVHVAPSEVESRAPVVAPSPVQSPPQSRAQVAAQPRAVGVAIAPSPRIAAAGEYGPTVRGDSLSRIARQQDPGPQWRRYAFALFADNPDAFLSSNPDRLKAGVFLRLPDAEALASAQPPAGWLGSGAPLRALTNASVVPAVSAATESAVPEPARTAASREAPARSDSERVGAETAERDRAQLIVDVQAAEARVTGLEQRLQTLDAALAAAVIEANARSRQAPAEQVEVPAAPTLTAVPTSTPAPETAAALAPETVSAIVANTAPDAAALPTSKAWWQRPAVWWALFLALVLPTAGWGAQRVWLKRQQAQQKLLTRVRHPRKLKESLPLPQSDDRAISLVSAETPRRVDRRIVRVQQVRAAVDTYLAYGRPERAQELLQQELHLAGDDLLLRRELQALQKTIDEARAVQKRTPGDGERAPAATTPTPLKKPRIK